MKSVGNRLVILAAAVSAGTGVARAATYTWEGATTGAAQDWSLDSNWSGTGVPNAAGDVVNLTADWTSGFTVNPIAPSTTLGILNIDDTGASTDASIIVNVNSSTLVMNNGASAAQINSNGGTANVINTPLRLETSLIVTNATQLTLGGAMIGFGNFTKAGAGTLIVSGTSSYRGATTISTGTLQLGVANALPTTTALNLSGIIQMNAFNQSIASLTGSGQVIGNHASTVSTLTINGSTSTTFAGQIGGSGTNNNRVALTKSGGSALTLTGTNTYFSGTNLNAGSIVLDYASVATGNRLADTGVVAMGGGELRLLGADNANAGEVIGAITAASGIVTLMPGSGGTATVAGASLARSGSTGSILFRGTSLGSTGANSTQVFFTTAPTMVGGAGTGTQTSIIPYALGDTSATGGGSGLVTYGANGIRLLDEASEYAAYGAAVTNDNAKVTAGGTISGSGSINSLLLKNTSGSAMTVTLADGTNLAPISGTFLFAGDSSNPITLTNDTAASATGTINLAANTSANIFVTAGTLATINAPILLNTTGGLAKDGAGTLMLNQNITRTGFATATTGTIAVNAGTLKAGAINIVGLARTDNANGFVDTVSVASGATLDINGFSQTFAGRGRLAMGAGSTVTNTGANASIQAYGTTGVGAPRTFNLDGTFTDGTPGDAATSGLISLTLNSSSSDSLTTNITHGGHTFNNLSVTGTSAAGKTATMTSLTLADANTIYGTVTLAQDGGQSSVASLTVNTVSDGVTVAKTLGDAPIVLTTTSNTGASGGNNGALHLRIAGASGVLDGSTLTWINNVTATGGNTSRDALITLDRNDGVSAGFTQQMGALTLSGTPRRLRIDAFNGTTLEFTGTTTLTHTAAATDTFNVNTGTLKLNSVVQSGAGNKTLTKSGAGTLVVAGAASYAGPTNVTNGTMLVNGTHTGGGAYAVNAATAVLGGTGTISAGVNLTSGGKINPGGNGAQGATIESLKIGALSSNAGGLVFDVNISTVNPANSAADLLAVSLLTATGDIGLTFNLTADTTGAITPQSFVVLTDASAAAPTATFNPASSSGLVSYSLAWVNSDAGTEANDLEVTFTTVPEPTSLSLLGLSAAGLLRRRRRAK